LTTWLFAFVLGVCWGYAARWMTTAARKPRHAPRLVYESAHSIGAANPNEQRRAEWDFYVKVFCFNGDRFGWSQHTMVKERQIMSRSAWEVYAWLLRDDPHHILSVEPRKPIRWGANWDLHKLRACIDHRLIALPYPDREPPRILTERVSDAGIVAQRRHTQLPWPPFEWPHLNRGDGVVRGKD